MQVHPYDRRQWLREGENGPRHSIPAHTEGKGYEYIHVVSLDQLACGQTKARYLIHCIKPVIFTGSTYIRHEHRPSFSR